MILFRWQIIAVLINASGIYSITQVFMLYVSTCIDALEIISSLFDACWFEINYSWSLVYSK